MSYLKFESDLHRENTMKHCIIRHRHLKAVMAEIIALAEAGYKVRWNCKKEGNKWKATSTVPIACSLEQLQEAVA